MKKFIGYVLILTLLLVCISSCSGYNKIMRDHLSNPANYQTFDVVLTDMCYQDPSNHKILRDFDKQDFLNYDITIYVTFETIEDISAFLGHSPNLDIPLEEYEISLHIPRDNSKVLFNNGFYENISSGDKITITSSNWVYMDSDFFYVAQVEYNGVMYLSFDDGLKNITDMMNKNKSLI